MTESDSTRQLTIADVNVNGCPHEKPLMGTGRPRKKCFLCQPHGEQKQLIVACSHCGKVIAFSREHHRGGKGRWYCCDECFSFAPSQNHRVKDWERFGTLYPTPRYCKNCGVYFSPARSRREDIAFCSKECNDAHRSKNDRRGPRPRSTVCSVCGEKKECNHGRGKTICAECYSPKVQKERREREQRKAEERFRTVIAFATRRDEKERQQEAERAERKRLKELKRQEAMLTKTCRSCGALLISFIATSEERIPTVCPTCVSETNKRLKATHRTARKAKQRAVSVESVDPILVFERDGWKCHLCGGPTPKEKRGPYEDDAPELDHIVTLADGGEHSYRNTACACRSCNIRKGSRSFGQLHLGLL